MHLPVSSNIYVLFCLLISRSYAKPIQNDAATSLQKADLNTTATTATATPPTTAATSTSVISSDPSSTFIATSSSPLPPGSVHPSSSFHHNLTGPHFSYPHNTMTYPPWATAPSRQPAPTPFSSQFHQRPHTSRATIVLEVIGVLCGLALTFAFMRCLFIYRRTPHHDRIAAVVARHRLEREMEELRAHDNEGLVRQNSLLQPPPPPYVPRPPSYVGVATCSRAPSPSPSPPPSQPEPEGTREVEP